ncbi:MAG TPA: hypothetical protein VGE62_04065 [Candidatus Paceibacterota bacterium]
MNKKFILILIIVLLAGIGYGVYVYTNKSDTPEGGVARVVAGQTAQATGVTTNTLDGPGREFVTQLLAIQNIKFNLSIFADEVYAGLQDFSQEIQPQPVGRPNPFAPLDDAGRAGAPTTVSEAIGNVSGSAFVMTSSTTSATTTRSATTTTRSAR